MPEFVQLQNSDKNDGWFTEVERTREMMRDRRT